MFVDMPRAAMLVMPLLKEGLFGDGFVSLRSRIVATPAPPRALLGKLNSLKLRPDSIMSFLVQPVKKVVWGFTPKIGWGRAGGIFLGLVAREKSSEDRHVDCRVVRSECFRRL